jgi:hypothetical protein
MLPSFSSAIITAATRIFSNGDKRMLIRAIIWISLALVATVTFADWAASPTVPCKTIIQDQRETAEANKGPEKYCSAGKVVAIWRSVGTVIDAWHDDLTAAATIIIAVFTTILGVFTVRLAGSTRVAADAALRQANATIALEAPILVVPGIKLVGYPDIVTPQSNDDPAIGNQIPAVCRALIGFMSIGRTYARITHFCLERIIAFTLPEMPQYLPDHIESLDTLFMPAPKFVNFFGLEHAINPIVLNATERQTLASGQSFWVYGYIRYESFADEVFELGFIARWETGQGMVAEANQNYAYRRKPSQQSRS